MAQQSSGIPLIEVYWSLVDKADKKFSKIRDLPLYERNRCISSFLNRLLSFADFIVIIIPYFFLGFVFDFGLLLNLVA